MIPSVIPTVIKVEALQHLCTIAYLVIIIESHPNVIAIRKDVDICDKSVFKSTNCKVTIVTGKEYIIATMKLS